MRPHFCAVSLLCLGFVAPSPLLAEGCDSVSCQAHAEIAAAATITGKDTCGIIVGAAKPRNCMAEGSGGRCSCLNLKNTCPYQITVKFFKTGGYGEGTFEVSSGKTDSDSACSGKSSQRLIYEGWHKAGTNAQYQR
jgi:hypothetical protein